MPGPKSPLAGVIVHFPAGYTQAHLDLMKAEFPDVAGVLNCRRFSIEVADDDTPLQRLKPIIAWIEKHLEVEDASPAAD